MRSALDSTQLIQDVRLTYLEPMVSENSHRELRNPALWKYQKLSVTFVVKFDSFSL